MSPEHSPTFDHSSVENFSTLDRLILIKENNFTFEMGINLEVGGRLTELRLALSECDLHSISQSKQLGRETERLAWFNRHFTNCKIWNTGPHCAHESNRDGSKPPVFSELNFWCLSCIYIPPHDTQYSYILMSPCVFHVIKAFSGWSRPQQHQGGLTSRQCIQTGSGNHRAYLPTLSVRGFVPTRKEN